MKKIMYQILLTVYFTDFILKSSLFSQNLLLSRNYVSFSWNILSSSVSILKTELIPT